MATDRDRRRRLGHDVAGRPYPTAMTPTTPDGRPLGTTEPVASRSTEAEARDLLDLRRAKRGDTGAFANLIRANDDAVRALVWALVGDGDLDANCTQVYLRAWRGLPLAPGTSPRIWLLGIADGVARDVLRRDRQHPVDAGNRTPPVPLDAPEDERLVVAAVEAVGLTPREVARLIAGGVDDARALLTGGRDRPDLELPLGPVPGHTPRFWDDLGRRLLIETSAPAATRPRDPAPPRSREVTLPSVDPLTSDAARGMAVRVHQQHPKVFPWRKLGLAVAVLATVVAFVGIALSLAGHASRRDAGLGDTATKTLNRLDAALARNTVVQGTVVITSTEPGVVAPGRYRFVRSSTGSWRITAADDSVDDGYDVTEASAATLAHSATGTTTRARVVTGLAPGPPEPTGVATGSPGDVLADVIRTVRRGSSGTAGTRTIDEKSYWMVTSTLDGVGGAPTLAGVGTLARVRADSAELVADQSLALPTRLTLRRAGRTVVTVTFSGLSISQQPSTTSYAPTMPPGVRASTSAAGFTPLKAGDVTGGGGSAALTPSYLPGGYVLSSAASDASGSTTVVCYRNGSRQLVLTRRPTPAGQPVTTDPFKGSDAAQKPSSKKITSGALAGSTAYSATSPIMHVWVNGSRNQVVAAGDPPVDQLTKVLASLR